MSDGVGAFLEARRNLVRSTPSGGHAARELSDLTDSAVSHLAEAALSRLRSPWTLIALGGWGARRLLPLSDLDLLILTDASAQELKPAISGVLYPLWDAGLAVGHQVRSRKEHLRMVSGDIETLTATLTGRVLCGDAALGRRLLDDVAAQAHRRSRIHLSKLMERERPGSPYLLEPDLKEGAGGQRDLDELVWTGALLAGCPDGGLGALQGCGLIREEERAALEKAAQRIIEGRWAVHRESTRPSSRLSLELAADSGLDVEGLQAALADVHHLLLRVRGRAHKKDTAFDPGPDGGRPAAHIDPTTLFELLDRGTDAIPFLEEAAWAGLLDDLVPAFGELMCARRPALSHLYTVGGHSLRCAALIRGAADTHPEAAKALASVPDRRTLQAAALVHDVGKAQRGPGHADRGALAMRTLAPRFGLSSAGSDDAATLVLEHLLLPETASGKDIHDEDVVLRAASHVGRRELVDPLYLLTVADSTATGPGAWTAWHAALIGELADRLRAALSDSVEGAGIVEQAEENRSLALAMLASAGEADAAGAFVSKAPLRYLAATGLDDIVGHARLVAEVAGSGTSRQFETAVTTGPAEGTWKVSVAALDRPGLFASACGALSLAGLDIMAADAYSADGGIALDVFVVGPDTLASADTATWASFERHLGAALKDPSGLATRLAERQRHYPTGTRVRTRVEIGDTGAYATAIKVRTADRVGLLYDLARSFADIDLTIRWARAITKDGVATDVFHVTDAAGEPVDDPGLLGHVAMRIRERVQRTD